MDTSDDMQHSLDESSISSASRSIHNDCDELHPEHDNVDENGEYLYNSYCDTCCFSNERLPNAVKSFGPNDRTLVKSTTASTIDSSLLPANSVTPGEVLTETTNTTSSSRVGNAANRDKEHFEEDELTLRGNGVSEKEEHCIKPSAETTSVTLQTPSLFEQLDIWFEKLCFSSDITTDDSSFPSTVVQSGRSRSYWSSMESIIASLGSSNPPLTDELDQFGSYGLLLESHLLSCCFPTTVPRIDSEQSLILPKTKFPRRGPARKQRVVEQLLKERGRVKLSTLPCKIRPAKSFSDVHDSIVNKQKSRRPSNQQPFDFWEHWLLGGSSQKSSVVATPCAVDEDGYDSDPGLTYSKPMPQRSVSPRSIMDDSNAFSTSDQCSHPNEASTGLMHRTVEETMNTTWNLVWIRNDKPVQVQIWIERGTVMQKNWVMVEPRLMWRPVGSPPGAPEFSMRLLQVCRIQESHRAPIDTPKMCRASASFVVRTIQKDAFWFQAATTEERDALVLEWKVVIARLATLAVLEDTKPLLKEFFLTKDKDYY